MLVTDASGLGNVADYLKTKLYNKLSNKIGNFSNDCIIGTIFQMCFVTVTIKEVILHISLPFVSCFGVQEVPNVPSLFEYYV